MQSQSDTASVWRTYTRNARSSATWPLPLPLPWPLPLPLPCWCAALSAAPSRGVVWVAHSCSFSGLNFSGLPLHIYMCDLACQVCLCTDAHSACRACQSVSSIGYSTSPYSPLGRALLGLADDTPPAGVGQGCAQRRLHSDSLSLGVQMNRGPRVTLAQRR